MIGTDFAENGWELLRMCFVVADESVEFDAEVCELEFVEGAEWGRGYFLALR